MYGTFIRQIRESVGLTQEQLAANLGSSQPTISAYEQDRKIPSADTLNRILVSCGYLLAAVAGPKTVLCPLPRGGWFEDEDLPPQDDLDRVVAAHEERGRMRADAPCAERVRVVDEVLTLASMQLGARRR